MKEYPLFVNTWDNLAVSNKSPNTEHIFNNAISSTANSLLIILYIFFSILYGIVKSIKSFNFIINSNSSFSIKLKSWSIFLTNIWLLSYKYKINFIT